MVADRQPWSIGRKIKQPTPISRCKDYLELRQLLSNQWGVAHTGSAFASNLFTAAEGFNWLSGADDIVTYQMPGRDISKSFCRVCGSGVPWSSGGGTKMIVPAGALEGEPEVAEKFKTFTAEQPLWSSNIDHIAGHRGFPS